MEISKDKVVTLDYTLTSDQGQVLDSSAGGEPLTYLHGSGMIIPGLEHALEGKSTGDQLHVSVPPDQGYGQRDEQMVQDVPRTAFTGIPNLTPGMQLQANTNAGPRIITVRDVQPDTVTIDANHPLAGATLNFDVNVKDVREATPDELAHNHVHGPGGHQH